MFEYTSGRGERNGNNHLLSGGLSNGGNQDARRRLGLYRLNPDERFGDAFASDRAKRWRDGGMRAEVAAVMLGTAAAVPA
jgi:hypothetical protein